MAIRSVVLRGFGNGTFNGTIPLVSTRGFAIGEQINTADSGRCVAVQSYNPGAHAVQGCPIGARTVQSYNPGAHAVQGR